MECDNVKNDDLIMLVRENPCIWDLYSEEYKHKNLKKDAWNDICQQLMENFVDMSDREKLVTCRYVQQRWKNLKDSFTKELKVIATTPSGSGVKKKREYIYFKQLEFLRKVVALKPTISTMPEEEVETVSTPKPEKPISRKRSVGQDINSKYEEEIFAHLATQGSCESESVHLSFIKSLLPTLETFSPDETLDFQGEVLNIVRNIKRQRLVQISHNYSSI